MSTPITLDAAPLGVPHLLRDADVAPTTQRHLNAVGLRHGVAVTLTQRLAGGGRVVSVRGGRIALGREVLARMQGEPVA